MLTAKGIAVVVDDADERGSFQLLSFVMFRQNLLPVLCRL